MGLFCWIQFQFALLFPSAFQGLSYDVSFIFPTLRTVAAACKGVSTLVSSFFCWMHFETWARVGSSLGTNSCLKPVEFFTLIWINGPHCSGYTWRNHKIKYALNYIVYIPGDNYIIPFFYKPNSICYHKRAICPRPPSFRIFSLASSYCCSFSSHSSAAVVQFYLALVYAQKCV